MKNRRMVVLLILILSLTQLCFSQTKEEDDIFEKSDIIIDSVDNYKIPKRFGSDFPGGQNVNPPVPTEEDIIVREYLLAKLLISNRILY